MNFPFRELILVHRVSSKEKLCVEFRNNIGQPTGPLKGKGSCVFDSFTQKGGQIYLTDASHLFKTVQTDWSLCWNSTYYFILGWGTARQREAGSGVLAALPVNRPVASLFTLSAFCRLIVRAPATKLAKGLALRAFQRYIFSKRDTMAWMPASTRGRVMRVRWSTLENDRRPLPYPTKPGWGI